LTRTRVASASTLPSGHSAPLFQADLADEPAGPVGESRGTRNNKAARKRAGQISHRLSTIPSTR
jgi:hypothetical protein